MAFIKITDTRGDEFIVNTEQICKITKDPYAYNVFLSAPNAGFACNAYEIQKIFNLIATCI